MNDAVKKWVDALRSGRYKQGQHRLHTQLKDEHFYCCLGVACELFMEEFPGEIEVRKIDNSYCYQGHSGNLPDVVQNWLCLEDADGPLGDGNSLAKQNDIGRTFDEIADIIERQPYSLFQKEA